MIAFAAFAFWTGNMMAQISPPYTQNFEGATVCTPFPGCATVCNITASTGWTNTGTYHWHPHQGPGPAYPNTGPAGDHTLGSATGKYLFVESSGCGQLHNVDVVSPAFNFTSTTFPGLSFWLHHNGTGFTESDVQTEVAYSVGSPAGPFTTISSATVSGNLGNVWNLVTVSLAAVGSTNNVYLRIRHVASQGGQADAAIDDVNVFAQVQYDAAVTVTLGSPTSPPTSPAEYYWIPAGLCPVPITVSVVNMGWDDLTGVYVDWSVEGTEDLTNPMDGTEPAGDLSPGESYTFDPNYSPSGDPGVTTYDQTFDFIATAVTPNEVDLNLANNQEVVSFRRHKDTYRRDSGLSVNGIVFNAGFNGYWAVGYDFPCAGSVITAGEAIVGTILGGTPYPPRAGDPVRVDLWSYNSGSGMPGSLIMESEEVVIPSATAEIPMVCPYPGGYVVSTPGIYVAAYNDVNNSGTAGGVANWISIAPAIRNDQRYWAGYPLPNPNWLFGTSYYPGMWRVRLKVECAVAEAGEGAEFCVGGCVVLGGNPTAQGPNGPFTYNWQPAAYVDDNTLANPTACPPAGTHVFTVQATDATGCIVVDQVTVTAFPYDVVSFSGLNATYCESDPPTPLFGNPPGGFSPPGTSPGTTWDWSEAKQVYGGSPVFLPDGGGTGNPGTMNHTASGIYGNAGPPGNDTLGAQVLLDSVYVGGVHTAAGDISLRLKSPSGVTVLLMDRPGSSGGGPAGSCGEDNWGATIGLGSGNPVGCPAIGSFTAAAGDLNDINDNATPANGLWQLIGGDHGAGDIGFMTEMILYFSPVAGNGEFDPGTAGPGLHQIIYCYNNRFDCASCDTQFTFVNPRPDATIDPVGPLCVNEPNMILTAATPGGTWSGTGIIDMFTGEFSPMAAGVGTHTITHDVTDANGCTNSSTADIVIRDVPTVDAGPDQTICAGETVQIGGSPTATPGTSPGGFIISYFWSPSAGVSPVTDPNPNASPTTTTDYTVTVTDGNGCAETDNVMVTVNPGPTVDAGPDYTACQGDPVTLGGSPTASGGTVPYTYDWLPAAGLSSTTDPNPTATPATTTTYTVTVTDAAGCVLTDQATVVVSAAVFADAGPDKVSCAGNPVTIGGSPSATGGTAAYGYNWMPGGMTQPNPTVNPATTTNYTLTVTDAAGCTATDVVTVTVQPAVVVSAGLDVIACQGGSADIGGNPTASAGTPPYTYDWQPPTYLSNPAAANPTATPPVSMSYTVTVSDANGCTATDAVVVTVAANPVADAGQNTVVCTDNVITIGGTPTASGGTPQYSYLWGPPVGLSSTTVPNPDVQAIVTTTYTVVVTDANGCTAEDQVTITVNVGPTAHAGPDIDLCIGDEAAIGGKPAATGGTPPYSFYWKPDTGNIVDPNMPNPVVGPDTTTTFVLYVDDNNGCQAIDSMTVTVRLLPDVTISGLDPDYCVNETLILITGTPTGGEWETVVPGAMTGNTFNPDVAGVGEHTIKYSFWDEFGCMNYDMATTVVHALPEVSSGGPVTAYKGHPTVLNATAAGAEPLTYQWDPTTWLDNPNALNPTATPHVTTLYAITVTDVWGCMNTDWALFTVDSNTPLNPPNTFTPEPKDGINDTWKIPLLEFFPENELKVYNRWGQIVYETKDYNNNPGWDGNMVNGNTLPGGTYFYVFTYLDHTGEQTPNHLVHRGPITIIRHGE